MTGSTAIDAHEHLLVRLQDLATDLMTVTAPDGTLLYLNPAARNAYGLGANDGVGHNLSDFLSAETMSMLAATARECRRTGQPTAASLTISGGREGDLRLETMVSYDPESGLFYNVQREVSAELQTTRSLTVAERLLALTGDAIAMIDADRNVVRTNNAFDRLFGLEQHDSSRLADLIEVSGATRLLEVFDGLSVDQPSATIDIELQGLGGRRIVNTLLQLDDVGELRFLVARDVTDERELRRQLEQRADSDALTELANRSAFIGGLTQLCTEGRQAGLVLFDLDGFKQVNDAHGHATGDALLSIVANRVTANVRGGDMVARLGGDEFVVLTSCDDPLTAAMSIARQLRRSLAEPYEVAGTRLELSASIGVASTRVGVTARPGELLHEADAAMYTAKRTGRNKFVVFDDGLRSETERRERLGSEIEKALAYGQIDVDVQAIVRLDADRVTGAEALVRWNHPTRGRLEPAEFLDLVVEKGLLMELTRQVLELTASGLSDWLRADRSRAVSINVSPVQLRDPDLLRSLIDTCARHGVEHQQLVCEFNEERLVDTIERTGELLGLLTSAGFRIAIDDFGAGASSLAYFRVLPIDFIKLDRGLIKHVPHSRVETTIVKSITELAMELGFAVCGEGVESCDQVEWLSTIGCQFAQGFTLHRPEPIADFLSR